MQNLGREKLTVSLHNCLIKATHLQGPNFAYSLCSKRAIGLQRNSKDKRISLDLSSVSHVFNAAEPVRLETLCTFFDTFEKHLDNKYFLTSSVFPPFHI